MTFDAVVIGTGFGGAVGSCRLAEANYRVLALERGRRWTQADFPVSAPNLLWSQDDPVRANGWFDLRISPRMAVAAGMPWFAQGRDAGNGRLRLRRRWILFGKRRLDLEWDPRESRPTIAAIIDKHRELLGATGGAVLRSPLWSLLRYLVTPHPLGGCNMGSSPAWSVVDHRGEVWGHPNLYVADGSIVPEGLAVNPSRMIAALAERIVSLIVKAAPKRSNDVAADGGSGESLSIEAREAIDRRT